MTVIATLRKTTLSSTCCLLTVLALQGCATQQNRDPLENFNRKVFGFNEALDGVLVKPAATAYAAVTPEPVQSGIGNFINNIKDVWSALNLFLQGRGAAAFEEVMRVSVNTTFGMAGFIDVATSMRLDRHNEDLGQTFGVWGVPSGAYLVLPFFGPSTLRDAVALPADQYFGPSLMFGENRDANGATLIQVLNARAQLLNASELLGDVALDKYAFVRDAYLQRRLNLIYNGEPPEEQTLWSPEVAPDAVLWQTAAVIPRLLSNTMPEPVMPVQNAWLAALLAPVPTQAKSLLDAGAMASAKPVPMGDVVVPVAEPTAQEIEGLGGLSGRRTSDALR